MTRQERKELESDRRLHRLLSLFFQSDELKAYVHKIAPPHASTDFFSPKPTSPAPIVDSTSDDGATVNITEKAWQQLSHEARLQNETSKEENYHITLEGVAPRKIAIKAINRREGAVSKQGTWASLSDKPVRRLRKKSEKNLVHTGTDNEHRGPRAACSICGQEIEPGAKIVCKGCMSRQNPVGSRHDRQERSKRYTDIISDTNVAKTESLDLAKAGSLDSGFASPQEHEPTDRVEGECNRNASLDMYNSSTSHTLDSAGDDKHHRTLTDLTLQSNKVSPKKQSSSSKVTCWGRGEEKQFAGDNSMDHHVQSTTFCEESLSLESFDLESLKQKFSSETIGSDEGSMSDLSHSEIYTGINPEKKQRAGASDGHFEDEMALVIGQKNSRAEDQQINVKEADASHKIKQRSRLERAKTDSEIVRGLPEHEEEVEVAHGEDMTQDEDSQTWTKNLPGKVLKRKVSSQSMDTGRGTYSALGNQRKKYVRSKTERQFYHDDRTQTTKSLTKGKGQNYKSRVEKNIVTSFRLPAEKDKMLADRKRSMEYLNYDSTARISNTSLLTEKNGKKAFTNLRSHTIIGGNMHRHREKDSLMKKEKNKEEEQLTVSEKSQPVVEAREPNPSVFHRGNLPSVSMTLYEIIEESEESYDDSLSEDDGKPSNISDLKSDKEAGYKKASIIDTTVKPRPLGSFAVQATEAIQSGVYPYTKSTLPNTGTSCEQQFSIREYTHMGSSDNNDENSRPFQGPTANHSDEEQGEDDSEVMADTEYLEALKPLSCDKSSSDIYYSENHVNGHGLDMAPTPDLLTETESPYHTSLVKYFSYTPDVTVDTQEETHHSEEHLQGRERYDASGFDETDVDTGITTLSHRLYRTVSPSRSPTRGPHVDPWGLPIVSASNSSNDSSKDSEECNDNWYTGGFFNEGLNQTDDLDDPDLVYFEAEQKKVSDDASDCDLYTGQVYSISNCTSTENAMGNEGNKTLNNNLIPYVQNNSKNNSVRQQMHRLYRRPKTRASHQSMADQDVAWTEGQHLKVCGQLRMPCLSHCNVSNNYNGTDLGEMESSYQRFENHSDFRYVTPLSGSHYTEFDDSCLGDMAKAPDVPSSAMGYACSSANESLSKDLAVSYAIASPSLKDILCFGDDRHINFPSESRSHDQGLYFASASLPEVATHNAPKTTLNRTSKGNEDYYVKQPSSMQKFNHNNNADCHDTDNNPLDEWYTGSIKNEEEYKPIFEEAFNTAPAIWPSHKAKSRVIKEDCFYQCSNDTKPYVSQEDCDYACERKILEPMKEQSPPKVKQLFKVGGIVVRDNVQDDSDYAKNINMDLQEEPRPYVRYDIGEHIGDEASDPTSYEKNTIYEDFTTSRPWDEDDRAPWRITRGQNCGFNMEKALKGAYDIKKTADRNDCNIPGPSVVKYLGSYVTRWF